jgi:hypothetical protein
MPKDITKTVYTFRELIEASEDPESNVSSRAVDRARDWLSEGAAMFDWYEFSIDDWTTALEQVGFTDAKINFSGFWSQGDGASFTSGLDIEKLLTFLTVAIEPADCIMDGEPGGWLPYVVKKIGGQRINRRYEWLKIGLDCFLRSRRWPATKATASVCGASSFRLSCPAEASRLRSAVGSSTIPPYRRGTTRRSPSST